MRFFVYDLETFPNIFTFCGKFLDDDRFYIYEISPRRNDREQLLAFLSYLQNLEDTYMVGFNNLGFDYPILHDLMNNPYCWDQVSASVMCQKIINQPGGGRGFYAVPMRERIIPQIDLYKINHFDHPPKATSLKALQFAMRAESVEDLPFDVRDLTSDEMDQLIKYNRHDVTETESFLRKNMHLIQMRKELLDQGVIGGDALNYSDTKIGVEYLVRKIGRAKCFLPGPGNKPRQSFRSEIKYSNVILPKISFQTEPFQAVLAWFKQQTLWMNADATKPKLEVTLANLPFVFGVGGVHASVENKKYISSDTHEIIDIDVSGMYVAVAIVNGFYPEHLGQDFVKAYQQLQRDRAQYPKGSTMNAVLKLAGNGVYGNSNQPYSCFYDPRYTFSVTLNGQLQLLQLAESLSQIPGLEIIQANTDGITASVRRDTRAFFDLWCREWEAATGLRLEEVKYKSMFIRDVNNYVAITTEGKIKRKGAYWYPIKPGDYEGWWNKDFSNFASIKAAEKAMTDGAPVEATLGLLTNEFDFMLRYKTPGGSKVYIGDRPQLKTVRYFVSKSGEPMRKVSPAKGPVGEFKKANGISEGEYKRVIAEIGLGKWDARIHTKNKSKYEEVTTSIDAGWKVKECNDCKKFDWSDVDLAYYQKEAEKLIIGGTV